MTPIPAGWKLVPIEPTPEMIKAWHDTYSKAVIKTGRSNRAYAAMLRAITDSPASVAPGDAQDERQAFEAWAKKKKMPLARIGQQYDDFWVDHAWNGWQARAALAAPAAGDAQTTAARDVLAERQRQIRAEGWTPDHDDEHSNGEIAYAATSYAVEAAHLADGMKPSPTRSPPFSWPPQWDTSWWKPSDTPRRNLVKAGALILAEIERLDRAAASQQQEG